MMSPPSDERLDATLRGIFCEPGEGGSEAPEASGEASAFRSAVLARAATALDRRRRRRAVAGLLALVTVVGAGQLWRFQAEAARAARRAALFEEHRRLQHDLEELRVLAERRSRLALGGDASTALVLDLRQIPSRTSGSRPDLSKRSSG